MHIEASVQSNRHHLGPDAHTTSITCTDSSGVVIWDDEIRAQASFLATNGSTFCAVGCDDGTVYTYTAFGRRVRQMRSNNSMDLT
eukprot:SAG31_NODE_8892_length_1367_cov_1.585962_3_plen_85_part_00